MGQLRRFAWCGPRSLLKPKRKQKRLLSEIGKLLIKANGISCLLYGTAEKSAPTVSNRKRAKMGRGYNHETILART
jgi:hypothetical protein